MNINMLMQQAKQMQKTMEEKMAKMKEELGQTEIEGVSGQGLVKVTMTGRYVVKRVTISPDLLQDEADMIEDMVAAAVNDATRQVGELVEKKSATVGGAVGLPPGLGGLI